MFYPQDSQRGEYRSEQKAFEKWLERQGRPSGECERCLHWVGPYELYQHNGICRDCSNKEAKERHS